MEASTQTGAAPASFSFADFLADITQGRMRASRTETKEDSFDLASAPGLEVCQPVHAPKISAHALSSVYQKYRLYLQQQKKQEGDMQAHSVYKQYLQQKKQEKLGGDGGRCRPAIEQVTEPTSTCSAEKAPLMPPGVLKRVGSGQSLVSTAASTDGEATEDDEQNGCKSMTPSPMLLVLAAKLGMEPAVEQPAPALHVERLGNGISQQLALRKQQAQQKDLAIKPTVEEVAPGFQVERLGGGHLKANWSVDAKRLAGKNRHVISPIFEISPGSSFKLMVKRDHTAHGSGSVDLKWMAGTAPAPTLRFLISVGGGVTSPMIKHDFGNNTVGGLGTTNSFVNLTSAVDSHSKTLRVSLEVLPPSTQPEYRAPHP